eukprot:TRINITY_DN7792_c0_g3_i1.p1 TRINITY_DN7792_c0_g3~~TRINITY_DN7792_c0_g3_i1.p1  ORF type:complete len:530 (+),score=119.83 TRINITY_DN7792_c0_g3_i1:99-1688(+)
MKWSLSAAAVMLLASPVQSACTTANATSSLLSSILAGYGPLSAPAASGVVPNTAVGCSIRVDSMRGIDSATAVVVADVTLRTVWIDSRLAWDAAANCGVQRLVGLRRGSVWVPDVSFDSAVWVTHDASSVLDTAVESTGGVTLTQRATVGLACGAGVADFPFDDQTCVVSLVSQSEGVVLQVGSPISQPELATTGVYSTSAGALSDGIGFQIALTRRWSTHVATDLLPLWLLWAASAAGVCVDTAAVTARAALTSLPVVGMCAVMWKTTMGLSDESGTMYHTYGLLCMIFAVVNVAEIALVSSVLASLRVREKDRRYLRSLALAGRSRTSAHAVHKAVRAELVELFRELDHAKQGVDPALLAAALHSFADSRGLAPGVGLRAAVDGAAEEGPGRSAVVTERAVRWLIESDLSTRFAHDRPSALTVLGFPVTAAGAARAEAVFAQAEVMAFVVTTASWLLAGSENRGAASIVVAVFGSILVAVWVAVQSRLQVGGAPPPAAADVQQAAEMEPAPDAAGLGYAVFQSPQRA